jgi:aspartyl-tRNA(Asn)/glutamyl-tRNA(Gln) amidotransferase subunit B
LEHEILRHVSLLDQGKDIIKETRRYDTLKDQTFSMRSKEQDPDYRFLQDPDLPCFVVSQQRIDRAHTALEPTPFEKKKEVALKYGLSIADVQTAFNHPWSLELFESMSAKNEPKAVF